MSARVGDDRLTAFRAAFDAARASWGEEGVFLPAVERPNRDLAALALRLGDSSHAVFAQLLELE